MQQTNAARLRAAVTADAGAIARVHVASWRTTYRGLMPQSYLDGLRLDDYTERWSRILEDPASRSIVFVVEEAEQVVGFASCGRERDGDPRYQGELYAIYLVREAQGRGHGGALVRACAAALAERGRTSMVIWVLRDNEPARRFYERLGGAFLRERPLDFGAGFAAMEVAYLWADVRGTLLAPP
jgi:ribosomal protein S18 acetylase RimI-like enzyme